MVATGASMPLPPRRSGRREQRRRRSLTRTAPGEDEQWNATEEQPTTTAGGRCNRRNRRRCEPTQGRRSYPWKLPVAMRHLPGIATLDRCNNLTKEPPPVARVNSGSVGGTSSIRNGGLPSLSPGSNAAVNSGPRSQGFQFWPSGQVSATGTVLGMPNGTFSTCS